VKWLATLGVGGVLAGFMFAFYRKDIKQYRALENRDRPDDKHREENTASNTRLVLLLEAAERNALRKTDLDALIERRLDELQRAATASRRTGRRSGKSLRTRLRTIVPMPSAHGAS
jgi:hypothetical protein